MIENKPFIERNQQFYSFINYTCSIKNKIKQNYFMYRFIPVEIRNKLTYSLSEYLKKRTISQKVNEVQLDTNYHILWGYTYRRLGIFHSNFVGAYINHGQWKPWGTISSSTYDGQASHPCEESISKGNRESGPYEPGKDREVTYNNTIYRHKA